MLNKKYVVDTNVLLTDLDRLEAEGYHVVLLASTLRELDKHKTSRNEELAFQARKTVRYIKNNRGRFTFDMSLYDGSKLGEDFSFEYQDDNILKALVDNQPEYALITRDVLLQYKAEGFNIEVVDFDNERIDDNSKYTGIKDVYIDDSEESTQLLADIYGDKRGENIFDLVQNEYVVLWDKTKPTYHRVSGEINGYEAIDMFRCHNNELIKLKYKPTEDFFMGKTKPLNVKQRVAFDMLQNNDIGVHLLLGSAGTGKDYTIVAHLMQQLHKGEINKIVFVRNIVSLSDAGETGYLPGDLLEKMIRWAAPFIDALGGEENFMRLYEAQKIEIQQFESIRGRSFTNCAVYCTEIQNMTDSHARMILSRIGKDSKLYLNGDTNQIDKEVFRSKSAINALKKLKGNKLFGMVTYDKTERSDIASLAELI